MELFKGQIKGLTGLGQLVAAFTKRRVARLLTPDTGQIHGRVYRAGVTHSSEFLCGRVDALQFAAHHNPQQPHQRHRHCSGNDHHFDGEGHLSHQSSRGLPEEP
ncbi:MAG: hypothetical protein CO065_07430 [Comamonadaceae bacterium CG_4_9_14_0_8_um_filter_57_21]|nr:MAG: hypothetical protein CO065_07430 [Comamonadaceae bacterium CG_4_9_14_0_8_um_filter_57_21]